MLLRETRARQLARDNMPNPVRDLLPVLRYNIGGQDDPPTEEEVVQAPPPPQSPAPSIAPSSHRTELYVSEASSPGTDLYVSDASSSSRKPLSVQSSGNIYVPSSPASIQSSRRGFFVPSRAVSINSSPVSVNSSRKSNKSKPTSIRS